MNHDHNEPGDASDEPETEFDDLVNRLTAYDDALRGGNRITSDAITGIYDRQGGNTTSLFQCLDLLEQAWPRAPRDSDSSVPEYIDRFRLERVLGVGGFGIVYQAYDPALRRRIALKVPRLQSLSSENLIARFNREARAAGSLDHPNIVPVYEANDAGPVHFIATAYCPGPNLAEWQRSLSTPVTLRVAAALIGKIASAVHYSHTRGVLHCDLKPGNVLLMPEDNTPPDTMQRELPFVPRLTDFGLATLLQDDQEQSQTKVETMILGTPVYMAPEQTEKSSVPVGPATDVYALGIMFYELLTGHPPFRSTKVGDIFDQIRNSDPVSPREIRREVPRDLETICLKSLQKNAAHRFASAQELSDELERWLKNEPIRSRPPSRIDQSVRWCRKYPAIASLIAVLVLAAAEISWLMTARYQDLVDHNDKLARAAQRARELQLVAEESERHTRDALYTADINRAMAALKDEDTRAVTNLLNQHIPATGQLDRRGFEWYYLQREVSRAHVRLLDLKAAQYTLLPTPDRRFLAVAGQDAIVRLFDPETGAISREIPTDQIEINGMAFSPDGQELATAGDDGTIRIWNLATGNERLKIEAHPGKAFDVIYSPSGAAILTCGDHPLIFEFDVKTGLERRTLIGHRSDVQSLKIGANGKTLVSTSLDRTVRTWDLETWTLLRTVDCGEKVVPLELRNGGSQIFVGQEFGGLKSILDAEDTPVATLNGPDNVESLALHPKGKILAAGDRAGRIRLWNVDEKGYLSESDYPPWQAHEGYVYSLQWLPGESELVSTGSDGRVIRWKKLGSQVHGQTKIPKPSFRRWCVLPDSRFFAANDDGQYQVGGAVSGSRGDVVFGMVFGSGRSSGEMTASANGALIADVQDDDNMLHLLRLSNVRVPEPTIERLATWRAHNLMRQVLFSPNSQWMAVPERAMPDESRKSSVWLLKLPGMTGSRLPVEHIRAVAFSPDSRRLALTARNTLILWDIESDSMVWNVAQIEMKRLGFSPDGRLIATVGDDRLVVLRNASDGTVREHLAGHRSRLASVAFSPDGRTLATCAIDGAVILWNVSNGQRLLEFDHPDHAAEDVRFSADGRQLIVDIRSLAQTDDATSEKSYFLIYDTSDR